MTIELVVISGKGGTGKTSVAASLAVLASPCVVADCDVDAADLHLVLQPTPVVTHDFFSGREAFVEQEKCLRCGLCADLCAFSSFDRYQDDQGRWRVRVRPLACEGCGVCVHYCGAGAIEFPEKLRGRWFEATTRCGPMVHAALDPGTGNSGKLVTQVRRRASELARESGSAWVITDGSPGIGCPVIASLTGATHVLAVTEPSVSGVHDLARLLDLTRHFSIPTFVCVNKSDISEAGARAIEQTCHDGNARFAGCIPYDPAFGQAQVDGRTVVEGDGPGARAIRALWELIQRSVSADLVKEGKHDETE